MDNRYRLGLDIGSTTIKVVLLDGDKIVHNEYRRHHSDVSGLLNQLFEELDAKFFSLLAASGRDESYACELLECVWHIEGRFSDLLKMLR